MLSRGDSRLCVRDCRCLYDCTPGINWGVEEICAVRGDSRLCVRGCRGYDSSVGVVFRLPRGTLLVMGATSARNGCYFDGTAHNRLHWVHVHFRADWTTCDSLSVSVEGRVRCDHGLSDDMAAYGAVLCFVELHCDVPVSPGGCGARSRVHEVLSHSSWVRRPRRVAVAGDQVHGVEFLGPCAQAHGRGGHIHMDMASIIRCIHLRAWIDTFAKSPVRTTTTTSTGVGCRGLRVAGTARVCLPGVLPS